MEDRGPDAVPEELDLAGLGAFLREKVGEVGELDAELIAGGRSNPTYRLSCALGEWVLRRPPYGLVLDTAHDMGREARVLSALAESPVPVPRVIVSCADPRVLGAPFYVMERLPGRTVRDRHDAEGLDEQERSRLAGGVIGTLLDLHRVDPGEIGLADFGRPEGFLERQLRRWRRQWEAAHTVDRAEVEVLLGALERQMPSRPARGLVHGDYKIDNVMVDRHDVGRVIGLLDWEMSTVGDPLTDLGLLLSFWDEPGSEFHPLTAGMTALPGFPSRDEVVTRYAAGAAGIVDADVVDWYISLADLKLAVIFEQIHTRHVRGHTVGEGHDGLGDMVEPLLARAIDRLARA